MKTIQPLTKSGIGICIEQTGDEFFSKENIETLLAQHKFIVLKKVNWATGQLQAFLEKFGELVKNERRENETALTLDGKRIATEVIRGNGRLPLHRDGLLMNTVVKYVAILCLDVDANIKNGRTYLSDSGSAWKEFPTEIKDVLIKNGIEGKPHDVTYYLKNEDKWYPFSGVFLYNNVSYPNGSMHYHKNERASYSVRIANIEEEQSYEYYNTMEKILESEDYTYYHSWEKGDLILFDNRMVMHGREAFEGERSLIQMQVKES